MAPITAAFFSLDFVFDFVFDFALLLLPWDEDPLDVVPLEEEEEVPLDEDPLDEDLLLLLARAPPLLPLSRTTARRTKATIRARKSVPIMLEAV